MIFCFRFVVRVLFVLALNAGVSWAPKLTLSSPLELPFVPTPFSSDSSLAWSKAAMRIPRAFD
jgi:hypothetical protein